MTLGHKFAVAVCIILVVVLGFAGYEWLKTHDALLQTNSQTQAQQENIDSLKADEQSVKDDLKQRLQLLESQKAAPATPQQIVIDTSKLIPSLPQPLQVQAAPPDPKLPDAPSQQEIVIPQTDFKAVRDQELSCQENQDKLNACAATGADKDKQLALTTQQRDEWEKTAKGGSFWHRTLTAAKWIGIGAGTGYLAARAHK